MENKLRAFRLEKNMSQDELAHKVGVSVRHIAFIEAGERVPSLPVACKIASVLKKRVEQIFLKQICT